MKAAKGGAYNAKMVNSPKMVSPARSPGAKVAGNRPTPAFKNTSLAPSKSKKR